MSKRDELIETWQAMNAAGNGISWDRFCSLFGVGDASGIYASQSVDTILRALVASLSPRMNPGGNGVRCPSCDGYGRDAASIAHVAGCTLKAARDWLGEK